MARLILACRTLERELNTVMEKLHCMDPVIWLAPGEHNVPAKRRIAIENVLSEADGYDEVVLVMSFCGGSVIGLNSGRKRLLLPCFDDCLGLLLTEDRRKDAYYLTEGWLAGERNILEEYRISQEKYGAERTKRIFSAMFRGYRQILYLDTGCGDPAGQEKAGEAAQLLNLEFRVISGTLSRLEALVAGKTGNGILEIGPNQVISLEMRGSRP